MTETGNSDPDSPGFAGSERCPLAEPQFDHLINNLDSEEVPYKRGPAPGRGNSPDLCVACKHDMAHHDQPDCWECSNAGTVCDLLEDLRGVALAEHYRSVQNAPRVLTEADQQAIHDLLGGKP